MHSQSDHCLFHKTINGQLTVVLVYVDDILLAGDDPAAVKGLIEAMHQNFSLKHMSIVNYFLGIEACVTPSVITLTQSKYVKDILRKTNLLDSNPCPTPSCSSLKLSKFDSPSFPQPSLYRSVVGALQYLTLTRPDIAYSVNKLSQFLVAPTQHQWQACKRVLRYLKGTITHGISFTPITNFCLESFADVDFTSSIDDRRSTTGFCIKIGNNLLS